MAEFMGSEKKAPKSGGPVVKKSIRQKVFVQSFQF